MRRVGNYEVLAKIGEGGMGVVYRARPLVGRYSQPGAESATTESATAESATAESATAESATATSAAATSAAATSASATSASAPSEKRSDPAGQEMETPHPLVALKLMHPEAGSQTERRARFLREAQLGRAVTHPNVAAVLDFGEVHLEGVDRTLFLAQELAFGRDLYYRAEIEGLPPQDIVTAIAQVALGLGAAHGAGVVHRDVKPTNILVSSEGLAKLLDFGLARQIEEAGPNEAEALTARLGAGLDFRTAVGTTLGTPGYSAPEQLAGASPHPAADVYALGVSLYQLLAGRMPYRADTLGELRLAARAAPPTLAELQVETPSGFSDYLATLLRTDPGARPSCAGDVAGALEHYARVWPQREPQVDVLTATGVQRLRSWLTGRGAKDDSS